MSEQTVWEYRVEVLGSAFRSLKPEAVQEFLNQIGEDGWETFSIHQPLNSTKLWVTAKRPLTTAARRRRSMPQEW